MQQGTCLNSEMKSVLIPHILGCIISGLLHRAGSYISARRQSSSSCAKSLTLLHFFACSWLSFNIQTQWVRRTGATRISFECRLMQGNEHCSSFATEFIFALCD